jgi:hypothetical protein
MNALSSQANVAGYKVVLLAASPVHPALPDAHHTGGHRLTNIRSYIDQVHSLARSGSIWGASRQLVALNSPHNALNVHPGHSSVSLTFQPQLEYSLGKVRAGVEGAIDEVECSRFY